MKRILLKSKIHRARVTEANPDYEGSITIDRTLMEAADLIPFERVEVYDITNGSRLATYVIEGKRGSGVICLNGAAARLIAPGDLVIICSYGELGSKECADHKPRIVHVDHDNKLRD